MLDILLMAAAATSGPTLIEASGAYQDCVVASARSYAKGPDDARVVVKTAEEGCSAQAFFLRETALRSLNRAGRKPREVVGDADAWVEGTKAGARRAAFAAVLTDRSRQ